MGGPSSLSSPLLVAAPLGATSNSTYLVHMLLENMMRFV